MNGLTYDVLRCVWMGDTFGLFDVTGRQIEHDERCLVLYAECLLDVKYVMLTYEDVVKLRAENLFDMYYIFKLEDENDEIKEVQGCDVLGKRLYPGDFVYYAAFPYNEDCVRGGLVVGDGIIFDDMYATVEEEIVLKYDTLIDKELKIREKLVSMYNQLLRPVQAINRGDLFISNNRVYLYFGDCNIKLFINTDYVNILGTFNIDTLDKTISYRSYGLLTDRFFDLGIISDFDSNKDIYDYVLEKVYERINYYFESLFYWFDVGSKISDIDIKEVGFCGELQKLGYFGHVDNLEHRFETKRCFYEDYGVSIDIEFV